MRQPSHVIMSSRDRDAVRERLAFEQAEAERERAERERPIREAEAKLAATLRELRENALQAVNAGRRDPGFEIPPSVDGLRMTQGEAKEFNRAEFRKFAKNNPHFDPATTDRLTDYLVDQDIQIADAATYQAAFERLLFLGLITERQPEPEPESIPEPQLEHAPESDPVPIDDGMEGTDPATGERRRFSKWEIDRMSAEEYRRVMFPQNFIPTIRSAFTRKE